MSHHFFCREKNCQCTHFQYNEVNENATNHFSTTISASTIQEFLRKNQFPSLSSLTTPTHSRFDAHDPDAIHRCKSCMHWDISHGIKAGQLQKYVDKFYCWNNSGDFRGISGRSSRIGERGTRRAHSRNSSLFGVGMRSRSVSPQKSRCITPSHFERRSLSPMKDVRRLEASRAAVGPSLMRTPPKGSSPKKRHSLLKTSGSSLRLSPSLPSLNNSNRILSKSDIQKLYTDLLVMDRQGHLDLLTLFFEYVQCIGEVEKRDDWGTASPVSTHRSALSSHSTTNMKHDSLNWTKAKERLGELLKDVQWHITAKGVSNGHACRIFRRAESGRSSQSPSRPTSGSLSTQSASSTSESDTHHTEVPIFKGRVISSLTPQSPPSGHTFHQPQKFPSPSSSHQHPMLNERCRRSSVHSTTSWFHHEHPLYRPVRHTESTPPSQIEMVKFKFGQCGKIITLKRYNGGEDSETIRSSAPLRAKSSEWLHAQHQRPQKSISSESIARFTFEGRPFQIQRWKIWIQMGVNGYSDCNLRYLREESSHLLDVSFPTGVRDPNTGEMIFESLIEASGRIRMYEVFLEMKHMLKRQREGNITLRGTINGGSGNDMRSPGSVNCSPHVGGGNSLFVLKMENSWCSGRHNNTLSQSQMMIFLDIRLMEGVLVEICQTKRL
mmetsp:Transcript_4351/g.16398  ORF Transcript_4351/g.16398 Transcript_4351/m.16398 type:complete len:664 (-) Transcript_4351:108-2099(-)